MFAFLFYVSMMCVMAYLGSFVSPYIPDHTTTGKVVTLTFFYGYMGACVIGCLHSLYCVAFAHKK